MGTETTPFRNEPPVDFSLESSRQAMAEALDVRRRHLGGHHPLIVDGKDVTSLTSTTSVNPAHARQIIGTVSAAGPREVDAALNVARQAFSAWRDTLPSERATIMFKAAAIMRARRFQLSALLVLEAGKPWIEADADTCEAIDFLEYYAREMLRLERPSRLGRDSAERGFYFYEPRGVAVVIAPWNFPLAIATGMTSAALVTGNTVVFKPASPTSVLGAEMVHIFHEAGVPVSALSFLPCVGKDTGAMLVRDPRVDLIAFTGSLEVGLFILREAGLVRPGQRSIKKVVAEMGGKNAIIVDSDADLDSAAAGVVRSAFFYSGQKCSACSRVIVHEAVYKPFLERLLDQTSSLAVGDPADQGTQVGPVISAEARSKILAYIERGKGEARLVLPSNGEEPQSDGFFVRPHVFVDVSRGATIAQEEIFGPVLAVFKTADFDQALELALSVPYALTGGVYSRDPHNLRRAFREFRVGNLYINRHITGALVGLHPFGGSRMSGVGSKAGGPDYLLQFLEPRVVTESLTDIDMDLVGSLYSA